MEGPLPADRDVDATARRAELVDELVNELVDELTVELIEEELLAADLVVTEVPAIGDPGAELVGVGRAVEDGAGM
ncbi:MAG: hypothetical protein M3Z00_12980 [Actinomycetota bacterium]|nr:hypothetical protein [Actinomycetota bacterium]